MIKDNNSMSDIHGFLQDKNSVFSRILRVSKNANKYINKILKDFEDRRSTYQNDSMGIERLSLFSKNSNK